MQVLIHNLIEQFSDVRRGKLWMGENFEAKLSRLSGDDPFTPFDPDTHCAAEIIAHLTAWRLDALLKIETGKGRLRDHEQENWPPMPLLREKGWAHILRDFDESLEALIGLLRQRDDTFLHQTYYDQDYGGEYPYAYLLYGLLHHDLYHLGQLGLILKKL
jgi:hypothetical protein